MYTDSKGGNEGSSSGHTMFVTDNLEGGGIGR